MSTLVRRRSRVRRPALIAALICSFALAAALASEAAAGSYVARFCAEGVTAAGDKGPFERFGNQTAFGLTNNCGAFNGLRVSHNAGNPGTQGAEGRWLAERPDGISVARIDYAAAGSDQSGGYFPFVIGDTDADPGLDVINGGAELRDSYSDFSVSGDVRRFGVRLICLTDGAACAQNPLINPEAKLKNVTYTLQDPGPPTIELTGGSLFEAPIQTGAQTVAFDTADAGSGVGRVLVLANGESAGVSSGNCALGNGFALAFKPCSPTLAGATAVDTAAAPWRSGQNTVQVCAEDYSTDGTANRACSEPRELRVLNGCAANPSPPTNAGQTLTLEWPGKRTAAVQTRQGRARTAFARVFGPAGAPLAGAAVCFSRRISDGSGRERVIEPGAITDAAGEVGVKIRGASSRTVHATYWVGPEALITKSIELRVAPRIRLELKPKGKLHKGEKMRIVAILRGKWKEDRRVCFYAERPGRDRVGCDRTGNGGRAREGYRPRRAGKTYFFAKTPNQRGYPYTNKRSKKKTARIVP
jgi:hypothetical protein